jgi:hypothetical protein
MKTLTIKDLARTNDLDRGAMAAVRGGHKTSSYCPPQSQYPTMPSKYPSGGDSSITATQNLQQYQDVFNATANGSAFLDCVDATNNTSQYGQNNIVVGR